MNWVFAGNAAKGVALVLGAARAIGHFAQPADLGACTRAVVAEGLHLAVGLADLGDLDEAPQGVVLVAGGVAACVLDFLARVVAHRVQRVLGAVAAVVGGTGQIR